MTSLHKNRTNLMYHKPASYSKRIIQFYILTSVLNSNLSVHYNNKHRLKIRLTQLKQRKTNRAQALCLVYSKFVYITGVQTKIRHHANSSQYITHIIHLNRTSIGTSGLSFIGSFSLSLSSCWSAAQNQPTQTKMLKTKLFN